MYPSWRSTGLGLLLALVCWLTTIAPGLASRSPLIDLRPSSPGVTAIFSGVFAGQRPTKLGVHDGQLAACPQTPNCVSSQSQDSIHQIVPLTYREAPAAAFAKLKQLIRDMERTAIIAEDGQYLYAEFMIPVFGFVDDVEFYLDEAAGVIHVRSASRLGESDLGVNRKRIETIRTRFNQLEATV